MSRAKNPTQQQLPTLPEDPEAAKKTAPSAPASPFEVPHLDDLVGDGLYGEDKTRIEGSPLDPPAAPRGRPDRATLIVLAGGVVGEVHALDLDVTLLGRGQEVDVRIDDGGISRKHARLTRDPDNRFYVEDLGSTNGTAIGETPVEGKQPLSDGDRIRLGKTTVLKFSVHDELERRFHRQMYESAVRDPLTGAFNRKYLVDRLRTELSYARRHGKSLSVLMLDIDHFKKVNDGLGHLAGDEALKALGILLQKQLRAEDVVARYGGEEFILVVRGIDEPSTSLLAERVRRAVESMKIPLPPASFKITVSIGVAFSADGKTFATPDEIIARADEKLYAAKEAGRNRVVL